MSSKYEAVKDALKKDILAGKFPINLVYTLILIHIFRNWHDRVTISNKVIHTLI